MSPYVDRILNNLWGQYLMRSVVDVPVAARRRRVARVVLVVVGVPVAARRRRIARVVLAAGRRRRVARVVLAAGRRRRRVVLAAVGLFRV